MGKSSAKSSLKDTIKLFIPPIVLVGTRQIRSLLNKGALSNFDGPYPTWEEAAAKSSDWDAQMILDKTLNLSLKLRDGKIEFQQDLIVYTRIRYSETILAFLAMAAGMNGGRIDIVDFGGSLGTNFAQNRKFLSAFGECSWNVIERAPTVELGKKHFENQQLRFFSSLDELKAQQGRIPTSFVFSGSLQSIDEPFDLLDGIMNGGADLIAFDRLLVSPNPQHQIFIHGYHDTYPTWIFSRSLFVEMMASKGFPLVEEFTFPAGEQYDYGGPGQPYYWCGLIFARRKVL